MAATTATRGQIVSRIAASLLGSYAFVWGLVVLGIGLSLNAGMSYSDALALASLYAFLVFLATFVWSFAAASALRVWCVLLGGGALMTAAGAWLTRMNG
ncbi:MAG TPA: iron uptake protein [Rhizobacter sp.]